MPELTVCHLLLCLTNVSILWDTREFSFSPQTAAERMLELLERSNVTNFIVFKLEHWCNIIGSELFLADTYEM